LSTEALAQVERHYKTPIFCTQNIGERLV